MDKSGYGWGTNDEIGFLDHIGTFRLRPDPERTKLLYGYYAGAIRRFNWGRIDPIAIFDYLKKQGVGR